MIKIEITIPEFYNDGKPIELNKHENIRSQLVNKFSGLTISNKNIGYWIDNNKLYEDINKIYTIIAENTQDTKDYITTFKTWLEKELKQEKIFILVSEVDIL